MPRMARDCATSVIAPQPATDLTVVAGDDQCSASASAAVGIQDWHSRDEGIGRGRWYSVHATPLGLDQTRSTELSQMMAHGRFIKADRTARSQLHTSPSVALNSSGDQLTPRPDLPRPEPQPISSAASSSSGPAASGAQQNRCGDLDRRRSLACPVCQTLTYIKRLSGRCHGVRHKVEPIVEVIMSRVQLPQRR